MKKFAVGLFGASCVLLGVSIGIGMTKKAIKGGLL